MFPRVVRAVYFREQSISRGGMYLLQRRCVRASCFQVPSAQARYPQKCAFRVSLLPRYMACIMWGSFAPRRRLGNRGLAFPLSLYLSLSLDRYTGVAVDALTAAEPYSLEVLHPV